MIQKLGGVVMGLAFNELGITSKVNVQEDIKRINEKLSNFD